MLPKRKSRAAWDTSKGFAKPLSAKQKTTLAMVARKGYAIAQKTGLADEVSFDAWRAQEAVAACGKRISEATHRDYEALAAHFYRLAGMTKQAFDMALKDSDESREKRQAMAVLTHHLQLLDAPDETARMNYAEAICKAQFRVSLELASVAQVRAVAMTVKDRMAHKHKPAAAAVGEASTTESTEDGSHF